MGLFRKSSKLYSIFNLKCPRCHEGDLFHTPTFSFKKPFDMPKKCPVCGLDFEPEPGYYYGAMFISYIFTGFFSLGFVMILHWVLDLSINQSFAALIVILAIFFVYIFRLSRSIWININYKYDPSVLKK
ncbi:MAG: DUF983 domain-containing protein [Bacteroidota bacterium]